MSEFHRLSAMAMRAEIDRLEARVAKLEALMLKHEALMTRSTDNLFECAERGGISWNEAHSWNAAWKRKGKL